MTAPVTSPTIVRSTFEAWVLAARPKTLPAAISPVIVGCATAWAEGAFLPLAAIAALAVALLLQIAANLANDVADFRRGADTAERLGPTRATQSGLIRPEAMVTGTMFVLALAAVPGLYLVWLGGPLFAAIGLLAMLAAVAYTAGPKPFGYLGLGEVFVFLFFGPVAVVGTNYVMSRQITPLAVLASFAMGFLISAILVVNNLRDIETDRAAGKRTLAVRFGKSASRWEYSAFLGAAYAIPLAIWILGWSDARVMIAWVTMPIAATLMRQLWQAHGRSLNPVLGGTARLCLWYAVAFGLGLAW
jgi:1,4-dihydroxy-2-naphthoate octaprenyltransferase